MDVVANSNNLWVIILQYLRYLSHESQIDKPKNVAYFCKTAKTKILKANKGETNSKNVSHLFYESV